MRNSQGSNTEVVLEEPESWKRNYWERKHEALITLPRARHLRHL